LLSVVKMFSSNNTGRSKESALPGRAIFFIPGQRRKFTRKFSPTVKAGIGISLISLPGRRQLKDSLLGSFSLVQLTNLLHRQVALYSTMMDVEIGCFG
jgi:hypothetical protein